MAPHRFRADAHNYNLTEAIRLRSASHAFEGKVFNVGSSCAFDADAIDQLSQGDSKIKELLQAAPAPVSMFVGPNGEQLADAVIGGEGMVVAEIDTPTRFLWIRNPRCRDGQPPDELTQSPQDESVLRSCPQLREAFPYDTQRKCLIFDHDKSSRGNSWQEWRPFGPTTHSTFGG